MRSSAASFKATLGPRSTSLIATAAILTPANPSASMRTAFLGSSGPPLADWIMRSLFHPGTENPGRPKKRSRITVRPICLRPSPSSTGRSLSSSGAEHPARRAHSMPGTNKDATGVPRSRSFRLKTRLSALRRSPFSTTVSPLHGKAGKPSDHFLSCFVIWPKKPVWSPGHRLFPRF